MERSELEPIVTILIASWRGDVLPDPVRWNACRKLDELLRSLLSADTIRRTRRAPKRYRGEILDALGRLITRDSGAERLAKTLLGALPLPPQAQSSVGLPSLSIHGTNNQISVGPHLGAMTQIINPPADYQRQQPAADAAVQDDPNRLLFKLMLLQRGDDVIEVRAIQTPLGSQPHATIRVPFLLEELDAVLVALNDIVTGSQSLTDTQSEVLRQHCLLSESRLHARTLERIGQYLYKHLFVDDVQAAFQAAIGLARQQGRPLSLQLFMDEDSVMLARYPWELLHDGRRSLLASNAVELRRHIAYPEATRQLHLDPPLNVLYVAPRPINLPPLSLATGQGRVPEQLRALERIGLAKITELHTPTFEALVDYVQHNRAQILHFDGHGGFGRRCRCRVSPPYLAVCQQCGANLSEIPPEGYLAFEDSTGDTHLVPSTTLGTILYSRSLQLAVLLACSSGVVNGDTLFAGVGPALIQAGVPAVIATQSAISHAAANDFTTALYGSLMRGSSIAAAMNNGRQKLLESKEWFIPVLYLRDEA